MKKILIVSFAFLTSPAFAVFTQWTSDIPNACGDYGTYYASMLPNQYTCASGEFLPANTLGCAACPTGYDCSGGTFKFNESNFQGAVKNSNFQTQNAAGVCAANFPHVIKAEFVINQYTCASGEFLPAYTLGCAACPNGYTCAGGTYTFNPSKFQGATRNATLQTSNENKTCAKNHPHILTAVFTPNEHNCGVGYYMPANTDGCALCTANSYCSGGTYAFNENIAQGIVSCATGLYAPVGMWESAQCGHILYVGDESLYLRSAKKTTQALHIDIDNDGVADFFGNMTTADVPMTSGTTHKLKVNFGGQTYSIYDDTVDIGEP